MTIKLDEIDRKLLNFLDMDARIPISDLAKKVRLSKQAVQTRIKNLEEKNILKGYYVVIDNTKLGYEYVRFVIALQNISAEQKYTVINESIKIPGFGWAVELDGNWDLAFILFSKNNIEIKKSIDIFLSKYGNHVKDYTISVATSVHHFQNRFISKQKRYDSFIIGGKLEKLKIDEIDHSILSILSKDGRASATHIAKQINESYKVVIYRIKSLVKKGIISRFRINLNYSELGYVIKKVFLHLRKIPNDQLNKLKTLIADNHNTIFITEAIGLAELEFEIVENNYAEFRDFIESLQREFKEYITQIRTLLIYNYHTINYLPVEVSNASKPLKHRTIRDENPM